MGIKFAKTKSISTSEKTNGYEKHLNTNSNNHIDDKPTTTTFERKIQKKKGKTSQQKSSSHIKVDKNINTDGNDNSSSIYIKNLVNGLSTNNILYDVQNYTTNYSDTPSKDVLELRDACIRRGIITSETNFSPLLNSIQQDHEESTYATTITVVINDEQQLNDKEHEK